MVNKYIVISVIFFGACSQQDKATEQLDSAPQAEASRKEKVQILNVGTFHMDFTTDGHSTEFDEHNTENLKQCKELAAALAEFKPNVVLVEIPPARQSVLDSAYSAYLNDHSEPCHFYGEIGLVAFEVARLAECKRVYGIDHKINYNFMIADQLIKDNPNDSYEDWGPSIPRMIREVSGPDSLPLKAKIARRNTKAYYDFMLNLNADMLSYVNSDSLFEGADEASEFYKRNLRMFANMNKLNLKPDDRVFVLMGAAHTAFFDMFIERSPYYESLSIADYLQ